MKILFLGSAVFGIDCLNALHSSKHNFGLIITQPPHPAGRGRILTPTPVAKWAADNSVPFEESANANSPEILERIKSYSPDLTVVVAFGQKISEELIDIAPHKAINVHSSLLPKFRGAAPINWAIIEGESQSGISIITLAQKMDAGQVLAMEKTDIPPNETAGELHDRLAKIAAPLLMETIAKIAKGTAVYTEQDHANATPAPKLKKSDGYLDFSEPAETLKRKIMGFYPWPEASAHFVRRDTGKCRRVIFAMAEVVEHTNPNNFGPGTFDEDLNVICGKNALKITKIKPAGGHLMDFKDFVNGWHCKQGDFFMQIDK